MCIALDESTSVENAFQGGAFGNYNNTIKPFARKLVEELRDVANITSSTFQSGVVEFASDAVVSSALTDDPDLTIANIDNLAWGGGNTNHEDAILKCQSTLPTPSSGVKNFIVFVTDGDPNECASNDCDRSDTCPLSDCVPAQNAANNTATSVKDNGTIVLPIFTRGTLEPIQGIDNYMTGLSSEGFDVPFVSFTGLEDIVLDIKQEILCGGF